MPRWVVRTGVLAGTYAVIMVVAALWMPHEWDWHVLRWFSTRVAPTFSPEISIVNIPQWNRSDVPGNRHRIASFLDGLISSNQRPSAVILDVEFDPCQSNPCEGPVESADRDLSTAIRLASHRFPVYATEGFSTDPDDAAINPVDPQDEQIYGALSGAAQTKFTSIPQAQGVFYRICYANVPIDDESGQVVGAANVWAMVARVLMPARYFASSPPCDGSHIPVRLGSGSGSAIHDFTEPSTFREYSQFDDKTYVIVGTTAQDRPPYLGLSGPELLGWALSNALDQGSLLGRTPYYDVQPQNGTLLLLVPLFSVLAVVLYMALFFALKRTRLRSLRPASPWVSAGVAAVSGLAVVGLFELLFFLSHHIQPQISLITFGVLLAAGLSGVRGSQILFEDADAFEAAPPEVYDYDVFISYAHEDRAWVFEHVYAPFRDATLPDGRKLAVFFDTASIRAGTAWERTLALAIDASRFIVPVYSNAYFEQPYCRFEIMRAHRKWVVAGPDSRCVLPIMLGQPQILASVDDIQALSIEDYPDLVQRHLSEIIERIGHRKPQEAGAT